MKVKNYWRDIDSMLIELIRNGWVKLPSLTEFGLEDYFVKISKDMEGKTFAELVDGHKSLLEEIGVGECLAPRLLDIAQKIYGYKGELNNQYHIARRVEPGNSKEMYRAHFDSHLFTLVLPIKIPETTSKGGAVGDLIYYPHARATPKNEVINFLGKAYYKRFASKAGLDKLSKHRTPFFDNFQDYRPLLFVGNTTLHTNKPVSVDCLNPRLTLLAHFFDPSPKYGIGNIVRYMRNR